MSAHEMESRARAYRELQAEIKALEEQADALKQQMIAEMDARSIEKLEAGEYTIAREWVEGIATDIKTIQEEE